MHGVTFSFVITGKIAATTLKFVGNARTKERWNSVFKCKKVNEKNKRDIKVLEFIFHFAVNSGEYLKRQFIQIW